jgi:hypothetical protein
VDLPVVPVGGGGRGRMAGTREPSRAGQFGGEKSSAQATEEVAGSMVADAHCGRGPGHRVRTNSPLFSRVHVPALNLFAIHDIHMMYFLQRHSYSLALSSHKPASSVSIPRCYL